MQAMHYILLIAEVHTQCALLTSVLLLFIQVDDKEIFKVCMEYFDFLGKSLYEEKFELFN